MAQHDRGAALRIYTSLVQFSARGKWNADDWKCIDDGVQFSVDCPFYTGAVQVHWDPSPFLTIVLVDGRELHDIHIDSLFQTLNQIFTKPRVRMNGLA